MYPKLWIVARGYSYDDLIHHVSDPTFDVSIAGVGVRHEIYPTFDVSIAGVGVRHEICEDLYVKTKILQSVTFCFKCHFSQFGIHNLFSKCAIFERR